MDLLNQNNGGLKFNLKAYGLIVYLLENGVPVKRAIASGKLDLVTIDISNVCKRIYPTSSTSILTLFKAGPFLVEKSYASVAIPLIEAYGNNVSVYQLTSSASVNIAYTLTLPPQPAILTDYGFSDDHIKILEEAGITNYKTISAVNLKTTDCFTLVSAPNWVEGKTVSNEIATTIKKFVESGGNFFAQNWAIQSFESACRFQTSGGSGFKQRGSITNLIYRNLDNPFIQIDGVIVSESGTFDSYGLDFSSLRPEVQEIIKEPGIGKYKATSIKHSTTNLGGNVYYLAGEFNNNSNEKINGWKMYLNALLVPAERPNSCIAFSDVRTRLVGQTSACVNDLIVHKLIIKNMGETDVSEILLRNPLNNKLQLKSGKASSGTFSYKDLTWQIPLLKPGESDTLTLDFISTASGKASFISYIDKVQHDVNQIDDTLKIAVDVHPLPNVDAGFDRIICKGEVIALGGENESSKNYTWTSIPSGYMSSVGKPLVSPVVSTMYILTVEDISSGCKNYDSVNVIVTEMPTTANAGRDSFLYINEHTLAANKPVIGTGEWSIIEGKGNISTPSDPITKVTELGTGENIFRWTVTNSSCGSSTDDVVIEVKEIIIPTTFTPNGDGSNDTFAIEGLENISDNHVQIFNRWGNLVFSAKQYKNDWGGTTKDGKKLSEDTYYCTVNINGKTVHKKYLIIKR